MREAGILEHDEEPLRNNHNGENSSEVMTTAIALNTPPPDDNAIEMRGACSRARNARNFDTALDGRTPACEKPTNITTREETK